MPSFNQVQLAGHATRDPEVRFLPTGNRVMNFGLAINQKVKDGDDRVCFIDITVWGPSIEWLQHQIKKGAGMVVFGRLDFRTWEAQDGSKRSKHEVTAWNIELTKGKADFEGQGDSGGWESGGGQAAPMDDSSDIPF